MRSQEGGQPRPWKSVIVNTPFGNFAPKQIFITLFGFLEN